MQKKLCLLCFIVVFVGVSFVPLQTEQHAYEIVIHDGQIVDGTGNPWYSSDLGIRDGRIAYIGDIDPGSGKISIDATGLVVAPGFIDIHTHSDLTLLVDGLAQSHVRQGVTMDVLGERSSVGPLVGVVLENYRYQAQRRYGFSDVDWTTIGGFFDRLERQGVSINVATEVAPQQIKQAVVGYEKREATPTELVRMRELTRAAMRDGAVGMSAAFEGPNPNDYPMEIIEIAKIVSEYGGYYESHIGTEGYRIIEEVRDAIEVAEQAEIPVHISHLKIRGHKLWGTMGPVFDLIEQARARGLDVTANQYPYTAMTHPWFALFPTWAMSGSQGKIVEVLQNPLNRQKLKDDTDGFLRYVEEHGGWEGIVASRFVSDELKPLEGKTVAQIAKMRGDADPIETCFDLIVEDGGMVNGIYHNMSEDDVSLIMQKPWVAISSDGTALRPDGVLGDGKPHPRSYGTHPRVLGKYVREDRVLTLEDAVRKMSSFPAQIMGLADRGLLKENYWADVVLFNPLTVHDVGTFENPAQYPIGIEHVIVNGVTVIENGVHTGATPGKAIRGPGYQSGN